MNTVASVPAAACVTAGTASTNDNASAAGRMVGPMLARMTRARVLSSAPATRRVILGEVGMSRIGYRAAGCFLAKLILGASAVLASTPAQVEDLTKLSI